jgi:hypothetical protein
MGDNPIEHAAEKAMATKGGGSEPSPGAVTTSGYLKWFVGGAAVVVTFVVAFVIGSASGWNAGKQSAVQLFDMAGLEQAACPIPGTLWGPEFHHCIQDVDAKARCPIHTSWDNKVGKCVLDSGSQVVSVKPPLAPTPPLPPAATTSTTTTPGDATSTESHCNLQGTVYVNGRCVFTNPNTGQQPSPPAAGQ